MIGAFPLENWAGFEPKDPDIGAIMIEFYGEEEFGKILEAFDNAVLSTSNQLHVTRPDLSVNLN